MWRVRGKAREGWRLRCEKDADQLDEFRASLRNWLDEEYEMALEPVQIDNRRGNGGGRGGCQPSSPLVELTRR